MTQGGGEGAAVRRPAGDADPRAADFAPLRLVPAEACHVSGVVDLVAGCYAEYGEAIELATPDADLPALPGSYPPPDRVFRVLLDGAAVVGTVAVVRTAERTAELKRVFLRRSWRGRGLGRRLSQWAFDWAAAAGCRTLHIWSDVKYATAHALYRRLGATDTGVVRKLGGVNDVDERLFVRDLAPPGSAS